LLTDLAGPAAQADREQVAGERDVVRVELWLRFTSAVFLRTNMRAAADRVCVALLDRMPVYHKAKEVFIAPSGEQTALRTVPAPLQVTFVSSPFSL
jgi:hypothetical protein